MPFLLRIPFFALGAASLLASVQGCDVDSAVAPGPAAGAAVPAAEMAQVDLDALVERMSDSHLEVCYRGRRQVLLVDHGRPGEAPIRLEYIEEVGCDGQGRFAIETHLADADASVMEDFEIGQLARQGYVFRHRDFAVRDPEAFRANYRVAYLGRESVAEIHCVVLGIERRDGVGPRHEVHLDPANGLILRTEQRDDDGQLLARISYESIELGADLSDMRLDDHRLPRRELEPEHLATELGFPVRVPVAPTGFRLEESAAIAAPEGRDWFKLTYSDGVESIVLLQAPLPEGQEPLWNLSWTRVGGALLVMGELDRTSVVAIGRLEKDFLLSWLDASF